ncbi:hypothetical protein FOZ63_031158 [Perkinsus olseni]|uniref:MoaB/Mog domain-containing protein n=1 Tax=Perkinsus olseni TaxID=32597 RepID=A0A7J6TCQ2_PEROL|nr:hypothetical protein FOZ63_031158 [Perkinsus olseni]KAF4742895.1 hypothetical protein FOZ62_023056 [Perkinsus olseni]
MYTAAHLPPSAAPEAAQSSLVPPKEYPMLSVEECKEKIRQVLLGYQTTFRARKSTLEPEQLPVPDVLGRVLAADVYAKDPFPQWPTSIMDGFLVSPVAVSHSSVKSRNGIPYRELRVVSNVTAGHGLASVSEHDKAAYVTTGTLVENTDLAVVKIEDCELSADIVRVPVLGVVAGLNLRSVGSDIEKGDCIASSGTKLTPALLALLKGISAVVDVMPVVKAAVVSSGDELVNDEAADTNGPMLHALLVERFGTSVEVHRVPPLVDDYDQTRQALLDLAASSDIVITTGAVSKGSKDFIKRVLEEEGEVLFGEVCLKPGKPTTFATLHGTPFFALPGNPASAYVTFFVFVEPFLKALLHNHEMRGPEEVHVTLAEDMRQTDPVRPEFVRATVAATPDGRLVARGVTGGCSQRSSRLLSCVGVNALVRLPAGAGTVLKGARMPCLLTDRVEPVKGGDDITMDDVEAEAFAFRRLVTWLQERTDVQNIDLMNLAGFCRNCLSKWYAEGRGVELDAAKERVYGSAGQQPGMPYNEWKARYQTPASEEAKTRLAEVHTAKARTACGHSTGPSIHHHTSPPSASAPIALGVVTCSDRASQGVYNDKAGPLVARLCGKADASVVVVPDDVSSIQKAMVDLRDRHRCGLVITTGGTGFSKRDVTPEAVLPMLEKRATGIEHMLLRYGQERSKSGLFTYLSRPVAGVLKGTPACVVVTLPGSPLAVEEILGCEQIVSVLFEAARIASET